MPLCACEGRLHSTALVGHGHREPIVCVSFLEWHALSPKESK
jgi:hypothetical protein